VSTGVRKKERERFYRQQIMTIAIYMCGGNGVVRGQVMTETYDGMGCDRKEKEDDKRRGRPMRETNR
jgi:hypothetical protein